MTSRAAVAGLALAAVASGAPFARAEELDEFWLEVQVHYWFDTGFSVWLRERIQVARDFTIADYTFTPYTSAEVYFDTRYGTFSRYRLTLGVTLPIDRYISVEPYLVRQVDWVPAGVITNALGFTVIAAF